MGLLIWLWCCDLVMVFLFVDWLFLVCVMLVYLVVWLLIFNDVMMCLLWFMIEWFVLGGYWFELWIELNYNDVIKSLVVVGYGVMLLLYEVGVLLLDVCIVMWLLCLVLWCELGIVYCVGLVEWVM